MLGFFKRNTQSVDDKCTERSIKAFVGKVQGVCLEAQLEVSSENMIPSDNGTNMTNSKMIQSAKKICLNKN